MSGLEVVWRRIYGTTKWAAFIGGKGIGDYYLTKDSEGDVYRCRLWRPYKIEPQQEVLVLSEELARAAVLEMFERRREDEAA